TAALSSAAGSAAGDRALDALAKAWLPHVYAWCHRLGGPGIDAEDAAHETLIAMCRNVSRVHGTEAFPSWLFGICRRVVANHRRRAWFRRWMPGPMVEKASPDWGPDRTAEANEAAVVVWKALDALPAAQREVLVLCELEERAGSEAADLLGVPIGTVKSRLRTAREAFRKAVQQQGGMPGATEAAAEVG
ncbi:MAG: sigma-70 family RNA polymerase sigma factor, partial [Myxococcota bacterium]